MTSEMCTYVVPALFVKQPGVPIAVEETLLACRTHEGPSALLLSLVPLAATCELSKLQAFQDSVGRHAGPGHLLCEADDGTEKNTTSDINSES